MTETERERDQHGGGGGTTQHSGGDMLALRQRAHFTVMLLLHRRHLCTQLVHLHRLLNHRVLNGRINGWQ